jgi:F-type H+-transporting ATPase subunit a
MPDVFPKEIFNIYGFAIRDTVISTWIMMGIILLLVILINRTKPEAFEILVTFLTDNFTDIMGTDAAPFIPMLGSLAIFIAFANIIGIIPGIISPTRDINTPLALAIVVFGSVYFYGIRFKGFWGYLKSLASPIILLPFELIGQLSRTLSLTLRLFGNIISGEMIIAILFALVPLFVPLPMQGFSIFVGLLQAYIFSVLASTYIAAGVEATEPLPKKERKMKPKKKPK